MTFMVVLVLLLASCARPDRHQALPPSPVNGEAVVFSAEDGPTTQFWLADPARPSVRRLIAGVAHEPGWPGNAALSPDGQMMAYTTLPQGGRDPDHGAELMVLTLASGHAQAVARGVDLRSTLIWTGSSQAVTFQSYEGVAERLWLQPAGGGAAQVLADAGAGVRLIPIGEDADGARLLAARYDERGVDLVSIASGSGIQIVAHLTDGVARNVVLDENARAVAFIVSCGPGSDTVSHGNLVSLAGGAEQTLPAAWGEIVGVAWGPSGMLVAGSAGQSAGLYSLGGVRLKSPDFSGFAQPLAWSPSGGYLALRVFGGSSAEQPGSAREAILSRDGGMAMITDSVPVRFVGWVTQAGQYGAR